jgi:WD40 repeat protein
VALPDGQLASGSADKTVRVLESAMGRRVWTLGCNRCLVRSLVSLGEGLLAVGLQDGTVDIWRVTTTVKQT